MLSSTLATWPNLILSSFITLSAVLVYTTFLRSLLSSQLDPIPIHSPLAQNPRRGAVTSENSICSQIGTDAILQGGSAADAIISTALCVGVIAMYHSGIGGGGFMLVRGTDGSYEAIDFRETAPAASFEDMYGENEQASLTGGLASGVPGELRGLEYLHKQYGLLPWARLFEPSIQLARNGFRVNGDLVLAMEETAAVSDFLTEDPAWAEDFAPNGTRVGLGDHITRKRYADTLEQIARGGPEVFYSGTVGRATIAALRAKNGTMSLEDLSTYTVMIRPPVHINYRNYRIYSCSAPASGAVMLSALKTIEGYEDMGMEASTKLNTHRLDEAFKFAYGERLNLGDPSFVANLQVYQQEMLNEATARNIRRRLSDDHTLPLSAYNPDGLEVIQKGTAHMIAIDGQGLAVSLTSTVNGYFGSQLMVPETGIVMNNHMNDFSIPNVTNKFGYIPSPANFIRPGKRPMSSLSPTLVEHLANSSLYFAIGAAGGSRIITSVAQTLWWVLDLGQSPRQALSHPRYHDQLQPSHVEFAWTFDNTTVAFMQSRGHNITWVEPWISDVYAIKVHANGTFEAEAEPALVAAGVSVV